MRKIASYAMAVLCFFMFCRAEAAVFNVTNVAELQTALTTAQSNGQADTINLAPGTYVLSSGLGYSPVESENFPLTIQGAGAWATILDGAGSHSILRIEQGALVDGTGANANVTIRGVTFRNASESSLLGGALFIGNYDAQTTIEDCVFQNNTAVFGGGALYLEGLSAQLSRNTFTGNSSTDVSSAGGAVYALLSGGTSPGTLTLNSNTFSDNFSVGWGAGIYATNSGPVVLTGNSFDNNAAGGQGGGACVSAEFGGSLTVSGNTFTGNFGSSAGGAYLASMSGAAIISRNIFSDNTASTSSQSEGGGVVVFSQNALKMMNNLFVGNTTSEHGAGATIYLNSNQSQITNNTFASNSSTGAYGPSDSLGGGMYITTDKNEAVLNIYNNIFWGNTAVGPGSNGADAYINDDGLNDGMGSTIKLYNNDFSSIQLLRGDHLSQGGNIKADPMFDAEYRLMAGSPCIDTGNNGAPELPAIDLGGDPRVQNGVVDMGVYEWGPRGTLGVTISPQGAVDGGGKWRVDGGEWHVSGETQKVLAGAGGHTVEFSEVAGWVKPVSQTVTVDVGQTVSLSGVYTPTGPTGSLIVSISPQGAFSAGAQWQVDGGVWHDGGYTQTGLSVGQHTVVYSDIVGWTNPGIQTVTITQGETANVTGTYAPQPTGSLRVTISPQEAIDAGAKWRLVGTGTWQDSGPTQSGIPVGQYTVEFSIVTGWVKPANKTVTITQGQKTNTSGTYTPLPTGSLKVTISPPAAVTAGAKWRRVGASTWQDSGAAESGIPVGSCTIEFSDVAGWTEPANKAVPISEGETFNTSGTYTLQTGSLVVTILPPPAVDGGAQWQVDGGDWHNSGDMLNGLSTGPHTVTFSEVAGWIQPANRTVTISNGKTMSVTETYTQHTGSLMVTISPQLAIDAGAKWRRMGTGTWLNSGATEDGIPVGTYTVEFSDVVGWTKPDTQIVMIIENQTANAGGTYVQQFGSLTVTITPQEAINAGAKWRRAGTSTWQDSGATETGIPAVPCTVEFSDVSGWTKPANKPVTINKDRTSNTSGTYIMQTGSLRVTIGPQLAVAAGAKWRRVGTSTWQDNGAVETGIPVGSYAVEFNEVVGWTKPADQTVPITDNQTTAASGTYVLQTGSLRVTISPQEAIDAGAKWRRVGTSTWQNSGVPETGIPVGQYTVEFKDVSGWTEPANQTVPITDGQTTDASGTYIPPSGSLRVTITPQLAIDAGAKWRRVGTATWQDSGATEPQIAVGTYTVEFSDVTGWTKPSNRTVTISIGQTTPATGAYIVQTGSMRVTISPSGAVNAGAKWRRVGTSTWKSSGTAEAGIPVGECAVEFSDVAGWTKPDNQMLTISNGQTTLVTGAYAFQTGSLRVTISPQEAIDAGAKWRRVGTSTWRASGATESAIPVGPYTVEFSDVTGWKKPANQAAAISDGQTTDASGSYTLPAGSLLVTISPSGAVNAGAKWRRVGTGTWQNSGVPEIGILVGTHTIEFSDLAGSTKPANKSVTIVDGQTTVATGSYLIQTGYLRVTISPPDAVNAGAKWRRVGTSTWRASGTTETGIPVGQYAVEFSDVATWTKPDNQAVVISNRQTMTASGVYTGQTGYLRVTISPQEAINGGAKWRRVGTSTWQNSGATEAGVPVGQCAVEFSDVTGWTKPTNQTVAISIGQTTDVSGAYVPPAGSLRMTISPQGAIDAGAQWRRTGTSTWFNSGATESGIPVGQNLIEFSDVTGWTKPANQTVTISNGLTTRATGTYIMQTGSLRVTISPSGAVNAGARWRRVGTSTWRSSGTTESGVPVGQYVIEFSDVAGWKKPDNQTMTISIGQTATTTGTYTP